MRMTDDDDEEDDDDLDVAVDVGGGDHRMIQERHHRLPVAQAFAKHATMQKSVPFGWCCNKEWPLSLTVRSLD